MPALSRLLALLLLLLCATAASAQSGPPPDSAQEALAHAERAWLAAYTENDRAAMARFLADGFTITFPNGVVQTKDDVVAGLAPGTPPSDLPAHYTENRTIRLIGGTAILTGIYVSPRPDGSEGRMRYTDTWMWLDGRWQVVASHLSQVER